MVKAAARSMLPRFPRSITRRSRRSSRGRNPALESLLSIDTSTLPPHLADTLLEARKIKLDHESYVVALRDFFTAEVSG